MQVCRPPARRQSSRRLAIERPAVRFSLDEWMLRLYRLRYDTPEYGARVPACQELIWDTASQVLQVGTDVILDWNQWSRQRRATWSERAKAEGCDAMLYYVTAPVEVAIERARQRADDHAHDIDAAGVMHLASLFEPRTADEGIEIVRIAP